MMLTSFRTLCLLAAMVLAPVLAGAQDEALELPPPPAAGDVEFDRPAFAPPIDLAMVRPLIQQHSGSVGVIDAPRSPISPTPAANAPVSAILEDLDRAAPVHALLKQMLFDQLREAIPGNPGDFLIDHVRLPDHLDLPESGWSVKYDFRLPVRGIGNAAYVATVTSQRGEILRRFTGSVRIDRESLGVQTTRVIRAGETIRPEDLSVLDTRLSLLPRGAFDDLMPVQGTTARREIRPGQWLTESMVSAREVIRRGQAVTMRLERGPITITAPGIAAQAGRLGEVIRVANAESEKEVFARVLSRDEVQVVY